MRLLLLSVLIVSGEGELDATLLSASVGGLSGKSGPEPPLAGKEPQRSVGVFVTHIIGGWLGPRDSGSGLLMNRDPPEEEGSQRRSGDDALPPQPGLFLSPPNLQTLGVPGGGQP